MGFPIGHRTKVQRLPFPVVLKPKDLIVPTLAFLVLFARTRMFYQNRSHLFYSYILKTAEPSGSCSFFDGFATVSYKFTPPPKGGSVNLYDTVIGFTTLQYIPVALCAILFKFANMPNLGLDVLQRFAVDQGGDVAPPKGIRLLFQIPNHLVTTNARKLTRS